MHLCLKAGVIPIKADLNKRRQALRNLPRTWSITSQASRMTHFLHQRRNASLGADFFVIDANQYRAGLLHPLHSGGSISVMDRNYGTASRFEAMLALRWCPATVPLSTDHSLVQRK
jgi:hypothetical protein